MAACTTCTCPHQKIKKVAFATCSDIPNLYGDDLVALPAFFDKEVTIRPLIWTEHLEKLEKNG
jgi:hypothetical protein